MILPAISPRLIAGLAIVTLVVGVFFYVHHLGVAAEKQAQMEREVAAFKAEVARSNAVAAEFERELAETRKHAAKINERTRSEVSTQIVYRECRLPASGLRLLSDALTGPR